VAIMQPYISAHVGNASFPFLYVSALVVLSNTLFGTFVKAALFLNFGSLVVNVLLNYCLFEIGVLIV
jgi:hypothetical protein